MDCGDKIIGRRDTDFYYYESRYYDPSFGRFISPDTIVPDASNPQTLNRYDGDGGRVKKIDGATTTRYISKLYECDTTGANTSCSRFIWANDTRIATVATNGTVHYWHGDHLGSSSVITDSTGAKVQALTYQPHGGVNTNQSFTTTGQAIIQIVHRAIPIEACGIRQGEHVADVVVGKRIEGRSDDWL